MIKFFRHIRQRMLKENRFTRYTLYAIGEIILVVIGILIALQINNWNEVRKAEKVKNQVLESLLHDIEQDRIMLHNNKWYYNQHLARERFFIDLIWKDENTLEEALTLTAYTGFWPRNEIPSRTTYDEMVSTGKLYYLSNNALVDKIVNYYKQMENHIADVRQNRTEFRAMFFEASEMHEYWHTFNSRNNIDEKDFEELAFRFANDKDSKTYKLLKVNVMYARNLTFETLRSISRLESKADEIKALISQELKSAGLVSDNALSAEKNDLGTIDSTGISLSELVSAGKTVEEIILIIRDQDKDSPLYDISEKSINSLGYSLMNPDSNQDALKIFKLNTELYPDAFNTYNSYGECLLRMGAKEDAIQAYQRSLELNPKNIRAKFMLFDMQ